MRLRAWASTCGSPSTSWPFGLAREVSFAVGRCSSRVSRWFRAPHSLRVRRFSGCRSRLTPLIGSHWLSPGLWLLEPGRLCCGTSGHGRSRRWRQARRSMGELRKDPPTLARRHNGRAAAGQGGRSLDQLDQSPTLGTCSRGCRPGLSVATSNVDNSVIPPRTRRGQWRNAGAPIPIGRNGSQILHALGHHEHDEGHRTESLGESQRSRKLSDWARIGHDLPGRGFS